MLQNNERSCDIRSEHLRSRIYALWEHEHELLEDAGTELSADLELFEEQLRIGVIHHHIIGDDVALFQAWLAAENYPNWEPVPDSVLNDLTLQELYLALAKSQLDLSRMTAQYGSTAEEELEHRNLTLTASECALAHAELLACAILTSRLH